MTTFKYHLDAEQPNKLVVTTFCGIQAYTGGRSHTILQPLPLETYEYCPKCIEFYQKFRTLLDIKALNLNEKT